jgi:hypothetical protein
MAKATGHDLHVDNHLTNVALNYRPMNLIADLIAPIVPVGKQSDSYPIWSQADALRVEDAKRAPGTEANLITRSVSSAKFYAENYALKTQLTIEDRENMDAAYISELRDGKARFLTGKMGLVWEDRLAKQVTSGSNVYSYSAIASAWTDIDVALPLTDIWTVFDVVQDASGYKINSMLMGGQAWRNFRRCDEVQNQLYGTAGGSPRTVTQEQAKALFELDRFIVGEAYANTADEGQSQVLSPIWGDHVLMYYAPLRPSIEEPSFMYSFRWTKPGLANMTVERHPFDSKTKAEEVELGVYQDERITSSTLAYLLTNVTSST